ncbi:MAG: hypothetical protein KTM48_08240, partial [Wolbachia endosymbiont of Pissodes strobi]|nr:hypothetical protein [Wolbachia endosymbiont of Pissodes strobi]
PTFILVGLSPTEQYSPSLDALSPENNSKYYAGYSTAIGLFLGLSIAYLAGAAALTPVVAVAVFIAATVVGALVGYGIGKFCEKVSEEKQNDPDMSMCTAIKNVLIPECLIHKVGI